LTTDFDRIYDRRASDSVKWNHFPEDILPLWVADMDFQAPEPILAALQQAVKHGIFGYPMPTPALAEVVAGRMESLYSWKVSPQAVLATPGVVAGFVAAAHTLCQPGEGVLVQPPVYPPILNVHEKDGLVRQLAPLTASGKGQILHYSVDLDAFQSTLNSNQARTGMFLLCNPHNPTGQSYSRDELSRMAALCLDNGTYLCSDEIHSEILLGSPDSSPNRRPSGEGHIPIASLGAEIAERTITLIAPSKTFNIPGLFCGFAIIPNDGLREKYRKTLERMALHVSSLGLVAAQAAFSGACDEWLLELRRYLAENRDLLLHAFERDFPSLKTTAPEATYLAWVDCRPLGLGLPPQRFFLQQAKVAFNDGAEFGTAGEGFVRINFGCPRRTLEQALDRMHAALAGNAGSLAHPTAVETLPPDGQASGKQS
jgi:cystathionine beta-lyase